MTPLTEKLTEENIRNLTIKTDNLVALFTYLQTEGYEAMNLKLIIDMMGSITQEAH